LSNISLDYDDEITGAGNVPGPGSGTFSLATNAQGGRGTIQTTITVSSSAVTDHFVEYVVSPSEILSMSTDPIDSTHPIQSGEVKLQTGSPFPTTTLDNKNYVLSMSGVDGSNGGSMTQLGLVTFGTSGNAGITFDTNDNGTEQAEQHNALGSGISFDVTSTGRTTILGTGGTAPILYLVDSTQGFLVSTKPAGSTISSGYFQQQTGSSLPTQAFFGGTAPTTGSQFDSGTAVFNAGNPALTGTLSGTDDGSSPANNGGLNPNSPIENNGTPIAYTFVASNPPPNVASFSPTAPGQGLFGSDILAYIVSPTKVVFMQIGATFGFGGYTPANITGGTPVNPAELYTGQQ
jgi:hypothetical protein